MRNLKSTNLKHLYGGKIFRKRALTVTTLLASLVAPSLSVATNIPIADPIPALIQPSSTQINLQPIAAGFISPIGGTIAPGDKDHIYVMDQIGKIWSVDISGKLNAPQPTLLLDVSSRLVQIGLYPPFNYDERGLLGLAFHPNFEHNGLFYTYTSEPANRIPDFSTLPAGIAPDHQSVVTEWRVLNPGDCDHRTVAVNSGRELLRFDEPQYNHNGGTLVFGPDQMLYISVGDGGLADDYAIGHAPGGNAQSLAEGNLLGKILRIDPLKRNAANGKYGIPADNPFVGKPGADEIFARGLRNPYRMSFDKGTGQLWISDVGQHAIEEVDVVTKGGNYGWPIKEGTFLFDNGGGDPTSPDRSEYLGFVYADSPGIPAGLIDPIAQYDHIDPVVGEVRTAAIGGYVYRGSNIKALQGKYVFGDYAGDAVFFDTPAVNGHLFVLDNNHRVTELKVAGRSSLGLAVLGWIQDANNELYLIANGTGTLNGTTGVVLKLTPAK